MSLRHLLAAAALCSSVLVIRADTYNFTLNGQGGGFSGSGTLTVDPTSTPGQYTVSNISGSGTSGPFTANTFANQSGLLNDNLFFSSGSSFFDGNGLGFYDQNPGGVFQVNLYSQGGQYFATYNEINTTGSNTGTIPVTFAATQVATTPEPSSLLLLGTGIVGVVGAARRRLFGA